MNHRVTVIGLGVMGQRMLGSMARYPGFEVVSAWDPDPDARATTRERFPGIALADSAAGAINRDDTQVVYIACPPAFHREHALAAFALGKSVFCEKPLGVDLAGSQELVAEAARCGAVNIVNFSLASAAASTALEAWLADGGPGEVLGVDIVLHFSSWPRDWQMDAAAWLSYRDEGGFTREVLSHWIYLATRLLGPATLDFARVRYPVAENLAETHLQAGLSIGRLPVSVLGTLGGAGPDRVEFTLWGSRSSRRIRDWNRLYASDGGDWQPQLESIADPREKGYELQLANAAAAVAGQRHSMPDFEQAFAVQVLIEAMLVDSAAV